MFTLRYLLSAEFTLKKTVKLFVRIYLVGIRIPEKKSLMSHHSAGKQFNKGFGAIDYCMYTYIRMWLHMFSMSASHSLTHPHQGCNEGLATATIIFSFVKAVFNSYNFLRILFDPTLFEHTKTPRATAMQIQMHWPRTHKNTKGQEVLIETYQGTWRIIPGHPESLEAGCFDLT